MQTEEATIETLEKPSTTGLVLYGEIVRRVAADQLVCFMPAALPITATRNPRQLSRLNWHVDMPNQHVLALADPAMALHDELFASWYLHPTTDLLEEMALMVGEQAKQLGVANDKVLFYGSSLGGFGALAMASLLPGSSAIAEVPQIDVAQWPKPGALRAMETHILGMPFGQFKVAHPYMVDLSERFKKSRLIPPFLMVTNATDMSLDIQQSFMENVTTSDLLKIGKQDFLMTGKVEGHGALSRGLALSLIDKWSKKAERGEQEWTDFASIG